MIKVRALIIDPLPVFMDGIYRILHGLRLGEYCFEVVKAPAFADKPLELIMQGNPDLVIMDQHYTSAWLTRHLAQLAQASQPPRILVLLNEPSIHGIMRLIRQNLTGFLMKTCTPEQLIQGISDLMAGDLVLPNEQTKKALIKARLFDENRLTSRESEILQLVADGLSTTEIAKQLFISPRTVHYHISNIMNKLNVSSRLKAVIVSRENGLISNF
ncbi:response regulator transcription factor [Cohnella lubricantis]|nr:response regulator transcription factor [Cohnella lubricantis]MBP2116661.1 DNA-binding NarL/FixJ family response regulator [Cohnella lubricantis]